MKVVLIGDDGQQFPLKLYGSQRDWGDLDLDYEVDQKMVADALRGAMATATRKSSINLPTKERRHGSHPNDRGGVRG